MKKSPKRRAVKEKVSAAVDILRQSHAARLVAPGTPREIRIAIPGVRDPRSGGVLQGADALPVSRFGLLHARKHIPCLVQVIIIQRIMFKRRSRKPSRLGSFNQQPTTRSDILMAAAFEAMVRRPSPHILHIRRRRRRKMHHRERSLAIRRIGPFTRDVDVRVRRPADRDVRVPKGHVALFGAGHVDLQDDGAGRDIRYREADVLNLRDADVAGITDLYDGLRVTGVAEIAADARDDGPGFSDDAGAGGDEEGRFEDVDAIGEVGDFAVGGVGGYDGVEGGGVIG